jgi:predicted HNH restriction endonuclease
VRVANKREVLKRDWLVEDPLLSEMLVITQRTGTNFSTTAKQEARLSALWDATGKDWTRDEVIAALWAYAKTYGQPISKKRGSPVSDVAALIGRAVSSVYNKLMNLRAIDPREHRAGFESNAATDEAVWEEFYDSATSSLKTFALEQEFQRLWKSAWVLSNTQKHEETLRRQVDNLRQNSLEELLRQYAKRDKRPRPRASRAPVTVYERDPLVIAIALERAKNQCEVPMCGYVPFRKSDGTSYLEVHHILRLADGGPDHPDNVVGVCPIHHRELHFGEEASKLRKALLALTRP